MITLQSYEADEIVDTLLECRSLLDAAGYSEDSTLLQNINNALSALGHLPETDNDEE